MDNKGKKKHKFFKWYIVGLLFIGCFAFALPNGSKDMVQTLFVDDNQFSDIIEKVAKEHDVEVDFIRAVIYRESKFHLHATGKDGEIGLMQIIPKASVADWARVHKQEVPSRNELFKPELNVEIGTWYLAQGMKRYKSSKYQKELALCFYNAGPSNAEKWRKATPENENIIDYITYPSTKKYVKTIMEKYQDYCDNSNKIN